MGVPILGHNLLSEFLGKDSGVSEENLSSQLIFHGKEPLWF